MNETHELAPIEKEGGGRLPQFAGIAWASKGKQIHRSLQTVVQTVKSSADPLKEHRYFVLAQPIPEVEKRSTDKRKAPQGTFKEKTEFGGLHSKVFDRLGLDLLQVTDDGKAVVHAEKSRIDQLVERSASLEKLGAREQARWATIGAFDTIPMQLRVDAEWLRSLKPQQLADIVIELQPVLSRLEADRVLHAIADILVQTGREKLTGTGTDFSGRHWFRGRATLGSLRAIAKDFFSVQAIHPPLYSIAAAKGPSRVVSRPARVETMESQVDPGELPCVAVVDLGVATDHKRLSNYRRGQFIPLEAPRVAVGDHGAFVASRIVFGETGTHNDLSQTVGRCSFYDAIVGDYPDGSGSDNRVNDKIVMEAIRGVRGAAPDVRVFNLSIGDTRPLDAFNAVDRAEKRRMLQDLDNFVFASDTIVVVAAGNSPPGVVPNPAYPEHHADPRWALGPWACGYNTLVCGAYVSRLSTNGLVQQLGWPSPFTRVGPGLCGAPMPSFGAPGGNIDGGYNFRPGLGVWGFSGSGLPEDRSGSSYAAPLLAREAAISLNDFQEKYCLPGTQPFAVTARAFLTLTAEPPASDDGIRTLVERTLGHGRGTGARLLAPTNGTAVMVWQGSIESPADIVRVQLPIPLAWLTQAASPMLRLVVCYDSPVNEAAQATWACRKLQVALRPHPDERAIRAPSGRHESHPVIDRRYRLARYKPDGETPAEGDAWLLEFLYEEIAPYPPGMDFDPRQRVAFAAELYDAASTPVDPQPALQALPIAATMTRLSVQPAPIRSPVIVRTR